MCYISQEDFGTFFTWLSGAGMVLRCCCWHKGQNCLSTSGANAVALRLNFMDWSRKGRLQFSPWRWQMFEVWLGPLNSPSTHVDSPDTWEARCMQGFQTRSTSSFYVNKLYLYLTEWSFFCFLCQFCGSIPHACLWPTRSLLKIWSSLYSRVCSPPMQVIQAVFFGICVLTDLSSLLTKGNDSQEQERQLKKLISLRDWVMAVLAFPVGVVSTVLICTSLQTGWVVLFTGCFLFPPLHKRLCRKGKMVEIILLLSCLSQV